MYRLIFWPVLAPSFLLGVASGAMVPVLVLGALAFGASPALAAGIVAMAGATALAVTVPVGVFIDRVGDRRAMAIATAAAVGSILLAVVALAGRLGVDGRGRAVDPPPRPLPASAGLTLRVGTVGPMPSSPLARPRRVLASALVALTLTACSLAPAPSPSPITSAPSPTAGATTAASTPEPAPASAPTVVGLGDSIMAGTNCACAGPLAAYADAVERAGGARPEVTNLGVAGWTSQDLRSFVLTDPDARAALAGADTVVVVIGANDLFRMGGPSDTARATTLPRKVLLLHAGVGAALQAIREVAGDGPDTYLVAGYWDILAPSGRSTPESAATTAAVNEALRAAAEDSGMDYVDLASAFAASGDVAALISDDGLHPNAEGIRVIGEALAAAHP